MMLNLQRKLQTVGWSVVDSSRWPFHPFLGMNEGFHFWLLRIPQAGSLEVFHRFATAHIQFGRAITPYHQSLAKKLSVHIIGVQFFDKFIDPASNMLFVPYPESEQRVI